MRKSSRVVVKVGTSSLTYSTGKLNLTRMEKLVRDLSDVLNQDREVLLVSSGAVGAGMGKLGLDRRPRTIPEKQAAAAIGQGILMHIYEKFFAEYSQTVAQVLLTPADLFDRHRYLNARTALETLFKLGVIPIVNENDTVATQGLKFGDNDTLSAMVAGLIDAEVLIILSDIDGLYSANPRVDPNAELISLVEEITSEIEMSAGGTGSNMAQGGMVTKIQAARIAASSGAYMLVVNSQEPQVIRRILDGESLGTLFLPSSKKLDARQRWIAYGSPVQGRVLIDGGAVDALLKRGKSLLPSGVVGVEGNFEAGCVVGVYTPDGREIARGISNYSSGAVDKIKGRRTTEILEVLGYKDFDEIIHRNNLTLI
ncbi:MAG: glutamate 5-kinase [Firmicutes bacterium]|nr:glutamate 5-kinase [Bacillota bacterium]